MESLFAGMGILICFSVLLKQFRVAFRQGCNSTADALATGSSLRILNQRHLISGAAMAALALYIFIAKREWLLLGTSPKVEVTVLTFILGTIAFAISLMSASKAIRTLKAPAHVSGNAVSYIAIRALFLILYEIFFRAILLNFCISLTSVPAAIAINVILYAVAHAFSSQQELLGTVPFGIFLCLITLYATSIWPAVLLHLLLGLSYDVFILFDTQLSTKTYVS